MRRKQRLWRAFRKSRELRFVQNNLSHIRPDDVLLVCTLRNERIRLPYFMSYYRNLGVSHFLFIDNDSDDGSREYLTGQQDVTLWHTTASYKKARFGVHWMNWIARKHCHGHWTLTVDPDEFFIFPFSDTRPVKALTDWLDSSGRRSFPAMLIDMYPKGRIDAQPYSEGQNPFEIAQWFDSGNYMISKNEDYGNLWIQGGPRARVFFHDDPYNAPSLNKIPLVKWHRSYTYVQSTHMLLPRGLNAVLIPRVARWRRVRFCTPSFSIRLWRRHRKNCVAGSIMRGAVSISPIAAGWPSILTSGATGRKNTSIGGSSRFLA